MPDLNGFGGMSHSQLYDDYEDFDENEDYDYDEYGNYDDYEVSTSTRKRDRKQKLGIIK